MAKQTELDRELTRLKAEYIRRASCDHYTDRYSYFNEATLQRVHSLERNFLALLKRHKFRRITLAPPIARMVAPRAYWLASLLEQCKVLNTHMLGIISKEEEAISVVKERGSTS